MSWRRHLNYSFSLKWQYLTLSYQERHYTRWAKFLRRIWKNRYFRLTVSWLFAVSIAVLAVWAIVFDLFQYQGVSSYSTDELGRACLAASIIMFDILILTQVHAHFYLLGPYVIEHSSISFSTQVLKLSEIKEKMCLCSFCVCSISENMFNYITPSHACLNLKYIPD